MSTSICELFVLVAAKIVNYSAVSSHKVSFSLALHLNSTKLLHWCGPDQTFVFFLFFWSNNTELLQHAKVQAPHSLPLTYIHTVRSWIRATLCLPAPPFLCLPNKTPLWAPHQTKWRLSLCTALQKEKCCILVEAERHEFSIVSIKISIQVIDHLQERFLYQAAHKSTIIDSYLKYKSETEQRFIAEIHE